VLLGGIAFVNQGAVSTETMMLEGTVAFVQPAWNYKDADKWAKQFSGSSHLGGCDGKEQSPLDINDNVLKIWNDNLLDTKSWYRCHSDVSISNDGNLVEIKGGGLDASYTTFRGHVYELESIRIHVPSETTIDGKRFPMEMQFMHSGDGARGRPKTMVLSHLYKLREDGPDNILLNESLAWYDLPKVGKTKHLQNMSDPYLGGWKTWGLNPLELLPYNQRYFHYTGSLSTPPCTQNVMWIVLEGHSAITQAQVDIFPLKNNYRPTQHANGRFIDYLSLTNFRATMPPWVPAWTWDFPREYNENDHDLPRISDPYVEHLY